MGSLEREAKRRFLKEQRKLEKAARRNAAATEYTIVWKRKPGIYEPGAVGHRC